MPHVTIEMLPGRSESIKQELADTIRNTVSKIVKTSPDSVSVLIKDVKKENWDSEVYDRIMKTPDLLYKMPLPPTEK